MKRIIDLCISGFGLLLISPVLLALAIWIKIDSKGPVFYKSERVGKNGKTIKVLKFRTMVQNADQIGGASTADDDPRITSAGRYLRRFNLDELPQLINVLKGEMSIVGPRPEVPEEVETYSEEEKEILSVKPGMTDYASIEFNNEGEILEGSENPHQTYREEIRPEKIRLARKYVREQSTWVDLKIIAKTLVSLFKRSSLN